MKYNLAEGLNLYANTTVGNVGLTPSERNDLVSYSVAGVVTISGAGDDILCLDCDLGVRVKSGQARYYFSSVEASGTVLPTVGFYYKEEEFQNYSLLNTFIGDGFYYSTISGSSTPRFVRLLHTISGTTISGTVHGFSLLNYDDIIDFGTDGTTESEAISTAVLGGEDSIKTIPIYNDGINIATAYASLEPQETNADDLLSIAVSSTGPWIGVRQDEYIIADKDEDNWDRGNHDGTEVDGQNRLTLEDWYTVTGVYTTKIFDNTDKMSFIDIKVSSDSHADSMVTKDENEQVQTIELRSSNTRPEDYSLYRIVELYYIGEAVYCVRMRGYYRQTGVVAETLYFTDGICQIWSYTILNSFMHIDNNTEKTVLLLSFPFSSTTKFVVYNRNTTGQHAGPVGYTYVAGGAVHSSDFHSMFLDADGGFWLYVYFNFTSTPPATSWADASGYYLAHFDANLNETFKLYQSTNFVYDCDVVYSNRRLWYTNGDANQVILIDDDGDIRVSFYEEGFVRGICTTSDNGCWFVHYYDDTEINNLIRLNEEGEIIATIENVGEGNISYIKRDGDDALWLKEGDYIKRFVIASESIDFSIYIPNADRLYPINAGVWVGTTDGYWKFIDRDTQIVERSVIYTNLTPGFVDHSYDIDNSYATSRFPITAVDTYWDDLEWKEVRPDKFPLVMGDAYHQARITLRPSHLSGDYIVDSYTKLMMHMDDVGLTDEVGHTVTKVGDVTRSATTSKFGGYSAYFDGYNDYITISDSDDWNFGTEDFTIDFWAYVLNISSGRYFFSANLGGIRLWIMCTVHNYYQVGLGPVSNNSSVLGDLANKWYHFAFIRNGTSFKFYRDSVEICSFNSGASIDSGELVIGARDDYTGYYYGYIDEFRISKGIARWPSESIVDGLYIQKSIEIPNIYPNNYKNMYLKASIPDSSMDWVGNYNTNLRTWWDIPE